MARLEKALIDLIQFHRSRYSTDLVLEKLLAFQNDIEHQRLVEFALKANLTTRRIAGFLMDFTGMDSSELHASLRTGKAYLQLALQKITDTITNGNCIMTKPSSSTSRN